MRADLERLRSLARDLEEEEWLSAKTHVLAAIAEIEAHRAQNVGGNVGSGSPIETAPRDDTLILVWRKTDWPDDPFAVVRWDDDWWQVHDGKNDHG